MAQPATSPKIEELRFRLKMDPKSRLFYPLADELRKAGQTAEAEQVLGQELATEIVAAHSSFPTRNSSVTGCPIARARRPPNKPYPRSATNDNNPSGTSGRGYRCAAIASSSGVLASIDSAAAVD